MRPPSSLITAPAEVGERRPKRLALGAASGPPKLVTTRWNTGCELMRTATVSSPPVTASETLSDFGSTSVRGPG